MESKNDFDYTNKRVGNYLILKELGKGAFGHVYSAQDDNHQSRLVAVKIFDSKEFSSQTEKESFLEEAEILKKLEHNHILDFYEANIHNDTPYLVIEYAPRGSLRERIEQHNPTPLPLQEAITILIQIGEALHYAHQQQVIHRDLKPENILFNARDDALLADFGIATKKDTVQKSTKLIGLRPYMSPEEIQGITTKKSDQYALGIIAYELFTGHVPFTELEVEAIKTEKPKPLTQYNPALPAYIEATVLQAIEKQDGNRHRDVSVFIARLDQTYQPLELPQERDQKKQPESFHVFLSYSNEDEDWAQDLALRLKTEKGYKVWLKKWNMIPGRPEVPALEKGIEQSKSFAICIGAKAPADWVEVQLQKAQSRQAQDPSFGVIPIYLPDANDLDPKNFLALNTLVDYRNDDPDYAFYLLECGIEGKQPGSWERKKPATVETASAVEIELRENQRLKKEGLIDDDEAKGKRRQILHRSLTSGSIKIRLEVVQQLKKEGLIDDDEAKEKRRQILMEDL